jgi:hypothetical protein
MSLEQNIDISRGGKNACLKDEVSLSCWFLHTIGHALFSGFLKWFWFWFCNNNILSFEKMSSNTSTTPCIFDPELYVDKNASFFQSLLCSICLRVFENPVLTGGCGHSFCDKCLQKQASSSSSSHYTQCALCRTTIVLKRKQQQPETKKSDVEYEFTINMYLKNVVDSMVIHCPYYPSCSWTCTRSLLDNNGKLFETHLKNVCEIAVQECSFYTNGGCPFRGTLTERKTHETTECLYRPVMCFMCKQQIPLNQLTQHEQTQCPNATVDCPNGCAAHEQKHIGKRKRKATSQLMSNRLSFANCQMSVSRVFTHMQTSRYASTFGGFRRNTCNASATTTTRAQHLR